ncbi:MAG: 7-carboxy-7-deazaguanine synthase QueE [Alloprevotella sp.]
MLINELFYSLQGEGFFTGTPSVFVRFAGCNLRCPFCDTDHRGGREMTPEEIVRGVAAYPATHVVLTGGEPSLFLTGELVERLHAAGKFVAVETNGTHPLPAAVDWVTLSPKDLFVPDARIVLSRADEIKVVYTGAVPDCYEAFPATHHFLQPCDTGDREESRRLIQEAIDYCLHHPQWRLSLQTHKLLGIR